MGEHSIHSYKAISDMFLDESAYVSPYALTYNKKKQRHLLTMMPVADTKTEEMCLPVYRSGPEASDFDVDVSGIDFPWKDEEIPFKDYPGDRDFIVCIDNIVRDN
jgi:hypothetical protein